MIPGIIPVGVAIPSFSYKEGFTGNVSNNGTVTINSTTPPSIYRYVIISAAAVQTSSNVINQIVFNVNGSGVFNVSGYIYNDGIFPSSSYTTQTIKSIPTGSSISIIFYNSLGLSMDYTIAIFEIPVTNLSYVASGAATGNPPVIYNIPIYQNGIVLASQFGQGGTGTWADMGYTFMFKIPVPSSAQQSLAVLYAPVNGTLITNLTNNAAYTRIYLASTWKVP